jgi:hypothetical protein
MVKRTTGNQKASLLKLRRKAASNCKQVPLLNSFANYDKNVCAQFFHTNLFPRGMITAETTFALGNWTKPEVSAKSIWDSNSSSKEL